mgnify:CR=1 FL=1
MSIKRRKTKFRTPIRRPTRQRSGFVVSGETTGGECKLKMAQMIDVNSTSLKLTFNKSPVQLAPSFNRNLAFVAFGGYLFPSTNVCLKAYLEYVGYDGTTEVSRMKRTVSGNKWGKFGVHCIFDMKSLKKSAGKLQGVLELKSSRKMGRVDLFGFELGTVYYYTDKDLWTSFRQKTGIYLPEIYYFDLEKPFVVKPGEYQEMNFSPGRCVVLKSCNRCARYLLIDIENERNTISFSNHCVSRAPCEHPLFSTYKIVENECEILPEYILKKRVSSEVSQVTLSESSYAISKIQSHYGYQLECRSCKKFYVNAPLNPMRDSTQHREDSLRRRALEVLVDELLDREWIYHTFRLEKGKEFDVYIWERFDKKCFKCGRKIVSPKEMDLDHTMPLAMLWPLDATATCLCKTCNSQKRDKFPVDFYSEDKLKELTKITGLSEDFIHSRQINMKALQALKNKVVWFFDEFLMEPDYQKVRKGKRTSDLIYKAVDAAIKASGVKIDLTVEYIRKTQHVPKSVSMV